MCEGERGDLRSGVTRGGSLLLGPFPGTGANGGRWGDEVLLGLGGLQGRISLIINPICDM